jgi:4-amino-4-deoxy-L-arabinose transferase-like glycosyltransferase
MPRKIPRLLWIAPALVYLLYFFQIAGAGILGADEPRYAAIGREMARSGDWITPRLWGEPWFEKPALLYWMTGVGFRLGLGPELAPRLPVALLSVAFLVFFWWILAREFGPRAAWLSTLILGTSAAWIGFSQVGVTDLPLTATFSAAMLLALPWIARRETRYLPAASALLGFAVLAKGLLPVVLAAPLAIGWRGWRDVIRPRVIAPFFIVALPWYVLCYLRNGYPFIDVFFIQHQFGRFVSGALQHVQPWWFYLPALAGLLLPWTPLLPLAADRAGYRDPRRLFLLLWVVFGLLFFSAAANKLPGYVLPLIPAVAALLGTALDRAQRPAVWMSLCALVLVAFPLAIPVLPAAVADGLSRAPRPALGWTCLLPVAAAAAVWMLEAKGRRLTATLLIAAGTAAGVAALKIADSAELDRLASARTLWNAAGGRASEICVGELRRNWQYGLNYYAGTSLPSCKTAPRPIRIMQTPGKIPQLLTIKPQGVLPAVDLH